MGPTKDDKTNDGNVQEVVDPADIKDTTGPVVDRDVVKDAIERANIKTPDDGQNARRVGTVLFG